MQTTLVGNFNVANAFGLCDMHGNVWEWCADHWHSNYEGAPSDGSDWIEKHDNRKKLMTLRGGSWLNDPVICRSASRSYDDWELRDFIVNDIGFRVVCAVGRT